MQGRPHMNTFTQTITCSLIALTTAIVACESPEACDPMFECYPGELVAAPPITYPDLDSVAPDHATILLKTIPGQMAMNPATRADQLVVSKDACLLRCQSLAEMVESECIEITGDIEACMLRGDSALEACETTRCLESGQELIDSTAFPEPDSPETCPDDLSDLMILCGAIEFAGALCLGIIGEGARETYDACVHDSGQTVDNGTLFGPVCNNACEEFTHWDYLVCVQEQPEIVEDCRDRVEPVFEQCLASYCKQD